MRASRNLVCRFPHHTKGCELILRPFDVLFLSRRVPLYNICELQCVSKQRFSYTVEKVELHRDSVDLSPTDFLASLCRK